MQTGSGGDSSQGQAFQADLPPRVVLPLPPPVGTGGGSSAQSAIGRNRPGPAKTAPVRANAKNSAQNTGPTRDSQFQSI